MRDYDPTLAQWLAAPRDFVHGFLGGLLGPVLALAGSIGLVYLVTRKLPALKKVTTPDDETQRAVVLASPLEARASWARHSGDLRGMMLEIKARAQNQAGS